MTPFCLQSIYMVFGINSGIKSEKAKPYPGHFHWDRRILPSSWHAYLWWVALEETHSCVSWINGFRIYLNCSRDAIQVHGDEYHLDKEGDKGFEFKGLLFVQLLLLYKLRGCWNCLAKPSWKKLLKWKDDLQSPSKASNFLTRFECNGQKTGGLRGRLMAHSF